MNLQISKFIFVFITNLLLLSESNAITIFVNSAVTVTGDGTSWPNAYLNLQDALAASQYGDEVWVAAGTYYPTTTTNRNISFEIPNGVKLYGGFSGNEIALSQRDWQLNQTILSGDIGTIADAADNSYTVVYLSDVDSSTALDGFTVTDGNADKNSAGDPVTGRDKSGGGAYITSNINGFATAPKLMNCVFVANNSAWNGGAVMVFNKQGFIVNPFFTSCKFSGNFSRFGGAVNVYGGNDGDDLIFMDCVFELNFARNGGAMHYYNQYGTHRLVLDSCLFDSNFAEDSGGAYFQEVTNPINTTLLVNSCNFSYNSALSGGGVASLSFVDESNIIIQKSVFNDNFGEEGASIQSFADNFSILSTEFNREIGYACISIQSSSVNIFDCIFNKCVINQNDGCLLKVGGLADTFKIVNSIFYENTSASGVVSIAGNISFSIANSVFQGNSLNSQGKLFSAGSSPFYANIYNCLFDVPDASYLTVTPITVGPGNLYNLDPLFLDTAANDYHLSPCSPARNAGSNAIVDSLGILTDIEGAPRIQGSTVDMGAYESPAFQASSATVTTAACGTSGLGSVALTLENGCPPFFINWSSPSGAGGVIADSSLALLNLPVGSHSITITDGRMESDTISVTIPTAPAIMGSANATDISCASGVGGTASIEAVGGTGAFSFLWSNGTMTAMVTNLSAGTYQVTVTDQNGCTLTDSVTVGITGNLSVGLSISPITCAGDSDGSATVQPIGGAMPFTWLWQNAETTPTLDSLSGGTYTATVTDALGCTGDIDFTITPPPAINVTITAMQPLCFGQMGTATASATGGTGSLHFAWDNGAMTASTFLAEGTHTVTVTDEKGCIKVESITIQAPPQLQVALTAEPAVLCFEASNGTVNVLPSGGTAPYTWSGPTENLAAGSYTVTLTDSNGCSATATATLAEHLEIIVTDTVTNASGLAVADGSIVLNNVLGGTGSGYHFEWSNGAMIQDLLGVASGDYTLTITDSQGCTASFSFFVDFETGTKQAADNPVGAAIVPNPSGRDGAKLVLKTPSISMKISVFDAQGRLVIADQTNEKDYALPRHLATGTYQVVLENKKERMVLTWVVGE